jgi:SnoaL-like domain
VENHDLDGMIAALAPDVTFHSPVVFKPYHGREAVGHLLSLVAQVFEDFEYVDELEGDGSIGLVFRARVGDRLVDGWDYLRLDSNGLIEHFMVMVRPLSAANALAEAMAKKFEAAPAPAS